MCATRAAPRELALTHRPSIIGECGLRPRLLLSARSAVEMCVTIDSAIYRIGTAKVQKFIGKGISQIVYVDGKTRQSTIYAGRGQPLLHRLQSQGRRSLLWEAFCFRSAANATEVRLALAVAGSVSIASAVRLDLAAHSTGSLPGPACMGIAVAV